MAEQHKLQKKLKRKSSTRREDGSEGQMSEKLMNVCQKLQVIADKEEEGLALLNSMYQTGSEPATSMWHKLTLERTLLDVKAELTQIQGALGQHAESPPANLNPVLSEEGNSCEKENRSSQDALQQAEQVIKHQRHQLKRKKPIQKSDAALMPSNGNKIVQHGLNQQDSSSNLSNSHATSVLLGTGNTAVVQSTVNININIGENLGKKVDSSDVCVSGILNSVLPLALESSGSEGCARKCKTEIAHSSGGAAEIATKRPKQKDHLRSKLQQQRKQHSRSVFHSSTVTVTTVLDLSKRLCGEWKSVGRELGLPESDLYYIDLANNNSLRETIFEMFRRWMQTAGAEATYNRLISALKRVERVDLAEKLMEQEDFWGLEDW